MVGCGNYLLVQAIWYGIAVYNVQLSTGPPCEDVEEVESWFFSVRAWLLPTGYGSRSGVANLRAGAGTYHGLLQPGNGSGGLP